jgi:DegV family protein with EDD domain
MPYTLVVTDSTCDLPKEWVQKYDIRIVPTYVQFGQESLADDGVQLTRQDFYNRLASESILPTTSSTPLGQTIETMSRALQEAQYVIAITASSTLSSIHNVFRLAANNTDPDRVTLIDSRSLSMGLGWQIMAIVDMLQTDKMPAEIQKAVLAMQSRVDVWAALDTMEFLRRSGRVSWAASRVGGWLQIKPIVYVHDGVVTSAGRTRTSPRMFEALVRLAHESAPLERLAVMHTNRLEDAKRLADALSDIHPPHEQTIVDVTPVIGVHVGPHGLGLGIVRQ